jgi:drug/metabolite transporter (DMT)-like permease
MRVSYTKLGLASTELLVATAFWGFGFVATHWMLDILNPVEAAMIRFGLAAIVGLPFIIRYRFRFREYIWLSLPPGLLLMLMILVMNWGLMYTTATKGVFITTMYVVFVPLIEGFFDRKGFPAQIWLCVGLALVGAALIANLGIGPLNQGDIIILGGAVLAAGQIYSYGVFGRRVTQALLFFFYQCFWASLILIPFVPWPGFIGKLALSGQWPADFWAVVWIACLGCTVLAFTLQLRAQRYVSPTVASLICLLEGPFAMLFALVFLKESLNFLEWIGAVIIFLAAITAILCEAFLQKVDISPQGRDHQSA